MSHFILHICRMRCGMGILICLTFTPNACQYSAIASMISSAGENCAHEKTNMFMVMFDWPTSASRAFTFAVISPIRCGTHALAELEAVGLAVRLEAPLGGELKHVGPRLRINTDQEFVRGPQLLSIRGRIIVRVMVNFPLAGEGRRCDRGYRRSSSIFPI